jgi:hypothetical protein
VLVICSSCFLLVIVIDGIYATETQKLRISPKYFVSIGDAEDAHLQNYFVFFSLPHRVDGGGRIHTLYRTKYICKKL